MGVSYDVFVIRSNQFMKIFIRLLAVEDACCAEHACCEFIESMVWQVHMAGEGYVCSASDQPFFLRKKMLPYHFSIDF